ncbi:MAG: hypothetical protein KAY24_07600 [Candidatus Eisenbacteria sp.]|nr:hypothetical protein [Candidatus Eisenbacteria bacterium]
MCMVSTGDATVVIPPQRLYVETTRRIKQASRKVEGSSLDLDRVGVKAAQFSFQRLKGADPTMGVAMSSTGEVGCLGFEMKEALLSALRSVGLKLDQKTALVSTGPPETKAAFLPVMMKMQLRAWSEY